MTALEHSFERLDAADRKARLSAVLDQLPPTRADGETSVRGEGSLAAQAEREPIATGAIPLLSALTELAPDGLKRGDVVRIQNPGSVVDYLTLALLAGALAAPGRLWVAAIGTPELGGVSLSEMLAGDAPDGTDALDRLLLVPDPGPRWPEVFAQISSGVDLVLLRPPAPVAPAVGRAVDARLRQSRSSGARHSAAVLVLGQWASARTILSTEHTEWTGLHGAGDGVWAGTGHLTGGKATVSATRRGTASGRRSVQLWLPGADGAVRPLEETAAAAPAHTRLTAVA
jgi:hypothetical protein